MRGLRMHGLFRSHDRASDPIHYRGVLFDADRAARTGHPRDR